MFMIATNLIDPVNAIIKKGNYVLIATILWIPIMCAK